MFYPPVPVFAFIVARSTVTYCFNDILPKHIHQKSLSHRPVGELTNTGVGAMGLKRGRPVRLHRPLVGPQKGRLLS